MFRTKTISTISTITSSSLKSLQNKDSLLNIKRENNKSDRSSKGNKRKIKQNRDVEQSVTLGEVYLIIHLCTSEIVKRGLSEPGIFNPIRLDDEKEKVRYLINCLLRDNRVEFEDELKRQNIHNVIFGIRMTLRNCVSNIVSYESYENFVKYERVECQYDPNNGPLNQFLSCLPRKNKGILIELFDLFAMIMENSHVNQIHPTRILKSMSLHIFNESQTKTYENFQSAYQDWLKYSNATIHLFLSYLRERACSTKLPERLNLLLRNYVELREKCFTNIDLSENGLDIILGEHPLPDITMMDLDSKQIFNQSDYDSVDKYSISQSNNIKTDKSSRNSLYEFFPEVMESLAGLNFETGLKSFSSIATVNNPETAKAKWKELQDKGLNILSEEALKLFFDYDDVSSDFDDEMKQKEDEQFNTSKPLNKNSSVIISNNNENVKLDYFSKDGAYKSTKTNSNAFSLASTIGPSSSNSGDTTSKFNMTSNKKREPRKQKIKKNHVILSFLCFKCYLYTDEPNYSDRYYEKSDRMDEWFVIEPRSKESGLDKNQKIISNNTDDIKQLSNRTSLSSVRSPNILPSQQFGRDIDDDLTKPQVPDFERTNDKDDVNNRSEMLQQSRFRRLYQDDVNDRSKILLQSRFRQLYQDDDFNNENQSPIGRISLPTPLEKQYRRSSNMSESSSIFGRQNIIRGKELPYPITPLRTGRQSLMRLQQYSQYSQQYPQQYSQYSQQYPQQYFQQFPQPYLQQFPQYPRYPQQHQRPLYETRTNTDVTVSTGQHYESDSDDYDDNTHSLIEPETAEDYDTVDAPYQSRQSQQQSQLYNQQEDVYYQYLQDEQ